MNIALPTVSYTDIAGVPALCDPSGVLFLESLSLLAVADLHLEKGAAFARRGMLLPPYDTLATLRLLQNAISRYNPKTIVCLGDNFHDRAGSSYLPDEWRQLIWSMADGRDWIWINGNHDPDGVTGLPGTSVDLFACGGLSFRHEPEKGASPGEIAGHLHPAATVRRREKSVRRPCFATDGRRLIMPAFGVMTGGLDLKHAAFRGLFDQANLVAHLISKERIFPVAATNLVSRSKS
jgi:DNA ligase-associated metallophosphoesterase